jgi:threonine dehydratase
MLHAQPDLDVLIVPVGGGGMLAGMASAAKEMKPGIEMVGVETSRFPSMYSALKGSKPDFGSTTIADGIAVREPGRLTLEMIRKLVDDIVLVDEGDIEEAMLLLLEIEKTVVEGAGAAGLAGLLRNRGRFIGKKVGVVLSGGNIDPLTLADIIERGMVRAGRLARIRVSARDVPGSLARITAIVSEAGANIDEVHHQRAFTMLAAQNVDIELVVQTRGRDHIRDVIDALHAGGFQAQEQ